MTREEHLEALRRVRRLATFLRSDEREALDRSIAELEAARRRAAGPTVTCTCGGAMSAGLCGTVECARCGRRQVLYR
jgi:ferric-dicitrate binding protein FerR (iron transport regulator)